MIPALCEIVYSSRELPPVWDDLADSYYKRREFLSHCEQFNSCDQRYYLYTESSRLRAGAIVYSLKLDLLTFLGISSPVTMHIVGVPCSVSVSGLIGDRRWTDSLVHCLLNKERGLHVYLNLDESLSNGRIARGRTLPSVVFENHFDSWDDYVMALRSPYRRRVRKIVRDASSMDIRTVPCSHYTEEMHEQYISVFNRSKGKLERLSPDFFRNLPDRFRLTTFALRGRVRGWVVTLTENKRLSFFLGGQDYSWDPETLYHVQLLTILQMGIASGATEIDFGQTAEVPKQRIGGSLQEKIMLGYHPKPLYNWFLRRTIGMLSYRTRFPDPHTFRTVTR